MKDITLKDIINNLKTDNHFAISRYGDGEFNCIFGSKGANCDKHIYFPELGKDLFNTLINKHTDDNYYYVLLNNAMKRYVERKDTGMFFVDGKEVCVDWVHGDRIISAARKGELYPFIEQLRELRIVYVGNGRTKARINNILPIVDFVEIPQVNCYTKINRIMRSIRKSIREHEPQLVGFSAGMPSCVMIYKLWPKYKDVVSMIDFGSLIDALLGIELRRYTRTKAWKRVIGKNLHG